EAVLAAREDGPLTSLADFCLRVRGQLVNRRVIESLVKCGAFDSIERNRARLLAGLDEVMRWAASRAEERASAQIGLLAGGGWAASSTRCVSRTARRATATRPSCSRTRRAWSR